MMSGERRRNFFEGDELSAQNEELVPFFAQVIALGFEDRTDLALEALLRFLENLNAFRKRDDSPCFLGTPVEGRKGIRFPEAVNRFEYAPMQGASEILRGLIAVLEIVHRHDATCLGIGSQIASEKNVSYY